MKIPESGIAEAYELARKVYCGDLTREEALAELALNHGLNRNTAGDLIQNYKCMVNGVRYTRCNNAYTTDYFLLKIKEDHGEEGLHKALSAVSQHLTYYEDIRQTKLQSIRTIVEKYTKMATQEVDGGSQVGQSEEAEGVFVETLNDLSNSVGSFMAAPEYWRDAIGNNPIYFVHYRNAGVDMFGLSKFCAFRGISLEDYIIHYRHTTNGNITQKHISKLLHKSWIPLGECDEKVYSAFTEWFQCIPNHNIQLDDIRIITIESSTVSPIKVKKAISPAELEKRLKNQREIGVVGEAIALNYELDRLKLHGIKNPEKYVQQVSLLNAAAGYDIRSSSSLDDRYIEVKSSTVNDGTFYISPNELQTLEKHCCKAYIYLVHVEDVLAKVGKVVAVIGDPVQELKNNKSLTPVMFQAKLDIA